MNGYCKPGAPSVGLQSGTVCPPTFCLVTSVQPSNYVLKTFHFSNCFYPPIVDSANGTV